jgi:polyhydroxybutyrate depolymerase
MNYRHAFLFVIAFFPALACAADPAPSSFNVDGTPRDALIFTPSSGNSSVPVVFVFHGHGGSMYNIARSLHLQTEWPAAIVVYMQGLPIQSKIDPEGKQAGWQHYLGEAGDRDLRFFDAVLTSLRENYRVDNGRIYATGFSNGGAFTYCLWRNRPTMFAAVAPIAGLPWPTESPTTPKPALIIAGENDKLIPIKKQEEIIAQIRQMDSASASQPQARDDGTTFYDSSIGTPVATLIHAGGHQLPPNAAILIADFFRDYPPSK